MIIKRFSGSEISVVFLAFYLTGEDLEVIIEFTIERSFSKRIIVISVFSTVNLLCKLKKFTVLLQLDYTLTLCCVLGTIPGEETSNAPYVFSCPTLVTVGSFMRNSQR